MGDSKSSKRRARLSRYASAAQITSSSLPARPTWLRHLTYAALLYFIGFTAYTYPAILNFSNKFFCDSGDGFQSVWNIWWVNYALRHGQNPYFTRMLYFPSGANLLPQTMHIYDGLMLAPMQSFLTLIQANNFFVLFSYVVGGLTMFYLAMVVTSRYDASLLAGYVFTFSSHHFAHTEGHGQLVSQEWLPLFFAFWVLFLRDTKIRHALAAAFGGNRLASPACTNC